MPRSQSPTVDTVIFDLDDTLIDWWGSIERCLQTFASDEVIDALQSYCRNELWSTAPDGDHIWHRNTWAMHTSRATIWPVALAHLDAVEVAHLMSIFDRELWVGFYPDTVPTLDALTPSYRLAVLTNNHMVDTEAQRLRLHEWFDVCLAALHPIHKPAPEAFGLALDALGGVPADRCVYVGDSIKSDVYGSRGAGLTPVWVNRFGDVWRNKPADVIEITALAELPAILATLNGQH